MNEQPNRPEVIEAIVKAVTMMDPAALAPLLELGVTADERAAADNLILASFVAKSQDNDRRLEAWNIFISAGLDARKQQSWANLFEHLTEAQAIRLGELYDVLEDGARAEFDRRYGRPTL